MKIQFEKLMEISALETYDAAMKYLNEWVDYATKNGYFEDTNVENDYTREFSRIAGMCADYENIYLKFKNIKFKNPLLVTIEKEMRKKNLNQRQTAELLDVKENTFSQILSGKEMYQ
ncbi:MAG: XRE family transcriptional regulator [Sphingobacteriales bacterium]|nr:XRE family transcriptional regulator [Sphingobacteriales bacterium]